MALLDLFASYIAIDLGTANTLVSVRGKGIVLNEPSIVAYRYESGRRQVLAVGAAAKRMIGRTPENIQTFRPLRDGVIADFDVAEHMIRAFLRKVLKSRYFRGPTVVVCVPSGATNVDKRIIRESILRAGARHAHLLAEPMAAALGVGLPVANPAGSMIIDIGGGTTEIAVISLGGVVYSTSIRVAGDTMDEAIINFVRRNFNLLIGEVTAERIKKEIGTVTTRSNGELRSTKVRGRDLPSGGPGEVDLTEEHLAEALNESVTNIVIAVQTALENTPPELSADIISNGAVLTGGGAMLHGLDDHMRERLGIQVSLAEDPLLSVAKGTELTLENIEKFHGLFTRDV